MTSLEMPTVTILASGVALGVYVPALLLAKQLRRYNIPTEICVLENYYKPESLRSLLRHKSAYQQNFALALTARKMPHNIQASLDVDSLKHLLRSWEREQRRNFIVWSGFWLPILESYSSKIAPDSLKLDFCRIDAAITPSFKQHQDSSLQGREIWFWQLASGKLVFNLTVFERQPMLWKDRQERYLLHGGGWGLGDYLTKACELEQQGLALNVIVRGNQEMVAPVNANRYFRVNPIWSPWSRERSKPSDFPPLEEWIGDSFQSLSYGLEEHALIKIIESCQAIISKPGGGTLIDAYASATPLVMLEPYGESEEANAILWKQLGYGIAYDEWKQMGFSKTVLHQLHLNLLERRKQPIDYPEWYAEEIFSALK